MADQLKIQKIYALTPMQEGMLYHYLYEKHGEAYVNQIQFIANGELDIRMLEEAANQMISRHEALRTNFVYENIKNPQQVVFEKRTIQLGYEDISGLNDEQKENYICEYAKKQKELPFNLTKDLLLRISVLKVSDRCYKFIWTFHHIIMDGWCNLIIIREFLSLYASVKHHSEPLLAPAPKYSDYINWLKNTDKEKAYAYWNEYLADVEETQEIIPQKRNAESKYVKNEKELILSEETVDKLNQICRETQVTMNTMMESLWGILLQKLNRSEDVVFGSIVSGRPSQLLGVESMIGIFINIVPVRVKKQEMSTFLDILKAVQEDALQSLPHQYVSLAEINKNIGKRNLLNHIMVFENYPHIEDLNAYLETLKVGFHMSDFRVDEQTNYDLNLIVETGDRMVIHFEYNKCTYDDVMIDYLMQYFSNIISGIAENPSLKVSEISLASEKEISQIRALNQTEKPLGAEKLLHQFLEEQAELAPDKTAITYDGSEMTYRQLNERANQLARLLRMKGVEADTLVGICLERSLEMMIGLMAVLKAGGAYLPIDPLYPDERTDYILDNSKCRIVLTKKNYADKDSWKNVEVICIDEDTVYTGDASNLDAPIKSSHLAYVIYTSGSTGKPKGVMIEHKSVVNRLLWMEDMYQLSDQERFLQKTPFTFDVSVCELFMWSVCGGSLHFTKNQEEKDVRAVINAIEEKRITIIHFVPSMFCAFLDFLEILPEYAKKLDTLRKVFTSGETLLPSYVERFYKITDYIHEIALYNLYGPTETTIEVTYYNCEKGKTGNTTVPIGKPIMNSRAYIVDPELNLLPVGVAGELCFTGACVARGYLNNRKLTDAQFVPCPFEDEGYMYKTGDLARWMSDGNIEFLGRIDRQVKLHGNRIELGEIESVLGELPFIGQGVVTVGEDEQGKHLCAYLVEKEKGRLEEVKEYLKSKLPGYMLPAYYISVENIPLTGSGKVNYKALPQHKAEKRKEIVPPATDMEMKLLGIWKEVLNTEEISVEDSFFELGGHSLLLVRLVSRIQKECGMSISYGKFIKNSSIREVAKCLETEKFEEEIYKPIITDRENMYKPFDMTDIQFAYYLGRNSSYELGGVATHGYVELETPVDLKRFNDSLNKIIKRHEMLRAVFSDDGKQRILEEEKTYQIPFADLVQKDQAEQYAKIIEIRDEMSNTVFDPSVWPLFDIRAIRLQENMYRLFISIDMLIADEMSLKILYRDFLHYYYNGTDLQPLVLTFRDYVENYRKIRQTRKYEIDKDYWKAKLDDFPGAPRLPLRKNPSEIEKVTFNRKKTLFSLDTTEKLKKLAMENQLTLSSLLISIYAKVLEFWCGGEDFSINMTVFNRLPIHEEVQQIVGDFTSVLPIEIITNRENTFWNFAHSVQEKIVGGIEHRTYSGIEFVRELAKRKNQTNQAVMPIVFTSTLTDDSSYSGVDASENILDYENVVMSLTQTSQVWIDCTVSEVEGQICTNWNYVEELFEDDVINTMFEQYIDSINTLSSKKVFFHLEPGVEDLKKIRNYNDTAKEIEDTTLTELFIRTAGQYPDRTAVVLGEESVTYRELDEKSNQVARYLIKQGVKKHDYVGVEARRVIATMINILGILKAGAAYVPIDPEYPQVRRDYIQENSGCRFVLRPDLYLSERISEYDNAAVKMDYSSDQVAYIIYTSGTTGKPKGVVITHKAAVNTILDINERFHVTEQDKILGISSMCFDLSVYDIFGAFSSGATLVMTENQRDIKMLSRLVKQHQITIWNSVPATFEMMVQMMEEEDAEETKFYWSPVKHWEIENGKLFIEQLQYPDTSVKYFPEFYFLAQKGVTKRTIAQHFENESMIEVEQLWNKLLEQKVLTDRILSPQELYQGQDLLYENKEDDEILFDPEKYHEFKTRQLQRNTKVASDYVINLDGEQVYPDWIEERTSVRKYDEEHEIPFSKFSKMLSLFRQKYMNEDGAKYYYASTGGLYSIDVYVYVKEGRVEGIKKGLYLYDACTNAVKLIDSRMVMDDSLYMYTNKDIFNSAAFSIFFVYNADASMPKYHSMGYFMAGIDTGIMVSSLTQGAQLSEIGLCSIGSMDFEKIESAFHLNKNQVLLHSVLGGLKKDNTLSDTVVTESFKAEPYACAVEEGAEETEQAHNSLRLALLSGDWIPVNLPDRIKTRFPGIDVISLGGATEGAIWSIFYEIKTSMKDYRSVPYGMPLSNQQIYILNKEHHICPVSVMGEIFIGGTGVALGYHNEKELTEKSFFHDEKLGYIYATGDYGVYRKEGYVEFLGRKDQQVKIKGHRIELSEIESALLQHAKISQATALIRGNNRGYKQIIAYLVPNKGESLSRTELEEYLQTMIPYYMIPSGFVFLEEMPLTVNRKVDRKALEKMETVIEEEETALVVPRNEVEKKLLLIWESVFQTDKISVTDNFFEIGGDSLTIMTISQKITNEFHVKLPLTKLFERPTIEKVAELIVNEQSELDQLANELMGLTKEEMKELLGE